MQLTSMLMVDAICASVSRETRNDVLIKPCFVRAHVHTYAIVAK